MSLTLRQIYEKTNHLLATRSGELPFPGSTQAAQEGLDEEVAPLRVTAQHQTCEAGDQ
jgi:hypothetical protein